MLLPTELACVWHSIRWRPHQACIGQLSNSLDFVAIQSCWLHAGIVLFWLLRQEPFTGLARELQGGHFDHADRCATAGCSAFLIDCAQWVQCDAVAMQGCKNMWWAVEFL